MKRVRSRTAEKKLRHPFSHYTPMGIFSDVQGQITWQSVVQSVQNSNSSELSCMPSLPASMKRNGWITADKKWKHPFFHHIPVCYHGNQRLGLAEFQTHPSSHVCHHYLQVWKGSDKEKPRKSGDIVLSHYKPMVFFQTLKGQLTLPSVVRSGRNSCMSSLPASMQRIGWKTAEKKWWHSFSIITLWELSVATETRVLIRSGPKPNAAFPPTQWCFR